MELYQRRREGGRGERTKERVIEGRQRKGGRQREISIIILVSMLVLL